MDANPLNPTVVSVLITAAGVVISAVVGALAATYTARLKTKEIELTYQQRLKDTYLQNARQYINGVYVPINIALRNFADRFRFLQEKKATPLTQKATDYFRDGCQEYERVMADLLAKGADAFLTSRLDERLQTFNSFLRASLDANQPVRRMLLMVSFHVPFTGYGFQREISQHLHGKNALNAFLSISSLRFSFYGMRISYRSSELLAAPIESPEFEEYISLVMPEIRFLIKEVTLGSQVTRERS